MSNLDLALILSPQAEDDFADILQYTFETWGRHQVYVYRDVLDKALLTIQKNPQIGHRKMELSPQHRTFPASPLVGTSSFIELPQPLFWYRASCINGWITDET